MEEIKDPIEDQNVFPRFSQDVKETPENIVSSEDDVEFEEANDGLNGSLETRRISKRENKGVPPAWFQHQANVVVGMEEPRNLNEVMNSPYKDQWIAAMKDEMLSLEKTGTWNLEKLPENKKAIGCRWVFKLKTNVDGTVKKFKARLVAQGFSQKYGTDYNEVFAPVVRQTTFRIMLSVAAKKKMLVKHLDVGFETDGSFVCKLRKSLYGLKQAARSWNEKISGVLERSGFLRSKWDPCLYSRKMGKLECFVLLYVDDLLISSQKEEVIENVRKLLLENFEIEDLGENKCYLGVEVSKDADGN
jgi:hypothetical protein